MKTMGLIFSLLLLNFCLAVPAYSGWLDDVKKSVEGSLSDKNAPEKKDAPITTKTSNTNGYLPYGVSWNATELNARQYVEKKGFYPSGRGRERIPMVSLRSVYHVLTNKQLKMLSKECFDSSGNLNSKGFERKKEVESFLNKRDLRTPNTSYKNNEGSSDVRRISFLWANRQGHNSSASDLFVATVVVSSLDFALDVLNKYGKPTIKKLKYGKSKYFNLYIYPLKDNIGLYIITNPKKKGAGIRYVNIPRLEAYDLKVSKYIESVKVKKQTKRLNDKKGF